MDGDGEVSSESGLTLETLPEEIGGRPRREVTGALAVMASGSRYAPNREGVAVMIEVVPIAVQYTRAVARGGGSFRLW